MKKITLKFKQKHKNNPDWFVFDTKINGTLFRVKIKKDETGKKIISDKEYLNNFLRAKLYQEIIVEINMDKEKHLEILRKKQAKTEYKILQNTITAGKRMIKKWGKKAWIKDKEE